MKTNSAKKTPQAPLRKKQGSSAQGDIAVVDDDDAETDLPENPAVNLAQQTDDDVSQEVETPAARPQPMAARAAVSEVEDETVLFIALRNVDHNIRIGHFDFTDKLGLTHLKQNQRIKLPKSVALVLVDRQVGVIA